MLTFRRHVVPVVAAFLALAVGIVLGGGPLSGSDPARSDSSRSDSAADPATSSSPAAGDTGSDSETGDDAGGDGGSGAAAADAAYAEQFAAAAGSRLYAAGLATAPVAVLAAPGADRDLVRAISTQVKAAGGRVTGRFVLQEGLLDPAAESDVDALGSGLVAQLAPAGVDPAATGYQRVGQLVGTMMATTAAAATPPDQTTLTLRQALSGADLVTSPGVPVAEAPLVVVVLGAGDDTSAESAAVEADLLRGLSTGALGTVVLGDEASAGDDGVLGLLRAEPATGVLATVDGAGSALAPVSTTLALIGTLAGRSGAFGAASADAALPLG